jgi:hypothetical protein
MGPDIRLLSAFFFIGRFCFVFVLVLAWPLLHCHCAIYNRKELPPFLFAKAPARAGRARLS